MIKTLLKTKKQLLSCVIEISSIKIKRLFNDIATLIKHWYRHPKDVQKQSLDGAAKQRF